MIEYKDTIEDFSDLQDKCWSGALTTLETIENNGLEDDLLQLIADYDNWTSLTSINDFLWFDYEYIYECLGLEVDNNED